MASMVLILTITQTHTLTIVVNFGANEAIVANEAFVANGSPLSPLNRHCHNWHHRPPFSPMELFLFDGDPGHDVTI